MWSHNRVLLRTIELESDIFAMSVLGSRLLVGGSMRLVALQLPII